jgi:hypothetical protein
MKKLILFLSLAYSACAYSQTAASVFTTDSIVYYGLDFSKCRLIGDFGSGDGYAMKTKMFVQWNDLVVNEPLKYNLQTAFHKLSVFYDMNPVSVQNQKTDESSIKTPNTGYTIDAATIQTMPGNYGPGDKKRGIGVVLIIESFDKTKELGTVYVTFFDIATKKVLFTEKKTAAPTGVGLRNYWAKTIFTILKEISVNDYPQWKKKYS